MPGLFAVPFAHCGQESRTVSPGRPATRYVALGLSQRLCAARSAIKPSRPTDGNRSTITAQSCSLPHRLSVGRRLESNAISRYVASVAAAAVAASAALAFVVSTAHAPDIRGIVPVLERWHEPGDLVIVAPAARAFDLGLLPPAMAAIAADAPPDDLTGFSRVIVVRPRVNTAARIGDELATQARLLAAEDAGPLVAELYQLDAPTETVVSLDAILPLAEVEFVVDGEANPCPWRNDRFDCGVADWTWVGSTTQTFRGEPFACIWAHPVEGAELRITFPPIQGERLVGWYGLTDYAVGIADGTPVRFEVQAGAASGRFRAHRQPGRRPFSVVLPRGHDGPIRFTIAAQRAGVRHFCWSARTLRLLSPP